MISWVERARRSEIFGQLIRFGLVGGFVTALGAGVYLAAALTGVAPLLANVLAYVTAMATGYVLHSRVSFKGHGSRDNPAQRTLRFVIVSLISFAINSAFVWTMTEPLGLPVWTPVIPMLLVTPLVTFTLNRRWVFA